MVFLRKIRLVLACSTVAAAAADQADLTAVRREVAALAQKLGDRAGVPEVADTYLPIPRDARWLPPAEARAAFAPLLPKLEKLRWWKPGLDPAKLEHALREPAAVVAGGVAAHRAQLAGGDRGLALAREAADFLLRAQDEAGAGVYPFPAVRGVTRDAAFKASERFLARAEKEGRLAAIVHRGWVVDDLGDGGLQFDNAEAGLALLELYAVTRDPRDLASVRRAADWAAARPLARNWNYNSFSVSLLARAYAATGERRYLEAARHKARVGVVPGQLTEGPRAGRWLDPHNARPAYHYIMLRALAHLTAVLPGNDTDRPEILRALRLGLLARNRDFTGPGAPNKDKAMETLLLVHHVFAADPAFLQDTLSTVALDALGRLVSAQFKAGAAPLDPREWGLFLEYAAARPAGP